VYMCVSVSPLPTLCLLSLYDTHTLSLSSSLTHRNTVEELQDELADSQRKELEMKSKMRTAQKQAKQAEQDKQRVTPTPPHCNPSPTVLTPNPWMDAGPGGCHVSSRDR